MNRYPRFYRIRKYTRPCSSVTISTTVRVLPSAYFSPLRKPAFRFNVDAEFRDRHFSTDHLQVLFSHLTTTMVRSSDFSYKPQEEYPFVAGILTVVATLLAIIAYLHVDMPLSILAIVAHAFLLFTTWQKLKKGTVRFAYVYFQVVMVSVFQIVFAHVLGFFHLFISLGAVWMLQQADVEGIKMS